MKESTEKEYRKASSQNYSHRSWQFFEEMKQAGIPMYNVEMAKSGRAKCTQKTKIAQKCGEAIPATAAGEKIVAAAGQPGSFGFIAKGELRMGLFDGFSGYGNLYTRRPCFNLNYIIRVDSMVSLYIYDVGEFLQLSGLGCLTIQVAWITKPLTLSW